MPDTRFEERGGGSGGARPGAARCTGRDGGGQGKAVRYGDGWPAGQPEQQQQLLLLQQERVTSKRSKGERPGHILLVGCEIP